MNPSYKILCIGVDTVPGSGMPGLTYPGKNAAAVARYFETLKEDADITLLTGKDATRENITRWITQCNADPGRLTVIFFFSGIGTAEKNKNNEKMERCLWIDSNHSADIDAHRLKLPAVLELFDNPLHELIVVIDACYEFAGWKGSEELFAQFKATERFTSLKPYVIISSSAEKTWVCEDPALRQGVLTHYFLRTLAGKYTSSRQKEITFFKLLEILDKKVRTHRFTTKTGRKRPHPRLMKNGIMVHYSDRGFKLPILEPIPLIMEPGGNFFQQKIYQTGYFLTCTRLRTKILLMACTLVILLLLVYLVQLTMARIQFDPPKHAAIRDTLLANQSYTLVNLDGERLGKKYDEHFSLYLFRHNWVCALAPKLDAQGKIRLLGNLLGIPISGIEEKQMVEYVLNNRDDIFYWNHGDIMKLMRILSREYSHFDLNRKGMVLELLAKLGKTGKITALEIFDLKNDTDAGLRKLFFKYFYTASFLEKNIHYLNPDDYLYLLENKKQLPASLDIPLHRETGRYLLTIAASIPDDPGKMMDKPGELYGKIKILLSFARYFPILFETQLNRKTETYFRVVAESIPGIHIKITDRNKLREIYEKLRILGTLGSNHFREKAAGVFKEVFDPELVMVLFRECSNFQDKLWLLGLYFKRARNIQHPDNFWHEFIYNYFRDLPRPERTGILKTILDSDVEIIPGNYRDNFLHHLRDVDTTLITLQDWENWIKRYPVALQYTADPIIEGDYPGVFSLLERHPAYFSEILTGPIFERLYRFNQTGTINLVKGIFAGVDGGDRKSRLEAAVFLYNKNYPEYSSFIIAALEKARDDIQGQYVLKNLFADVNAAVIKIAGNDKNLKENLKPLLNQPDLFYRFFRTNLCFWPEETIRWVLTSKVPKYIDEGWPFLRICEQLPHPYLETMLVKIGQADLDEGFRLNAEPVLVKHLPGQFIELAFNGAYRWERSTDDNVVKAYQAFSYKVLIAELILNLRQKSYRKVGFICEAIINKKTGEMLDIRDLGRILETFNRPLERILLRRLRYYVHKHRFKV
jgi:hypothetical protein